MTRTTFAPRLRPEVLEAIVRLDDRRVPIAEVNRRVGVEAWRLGLPRPSYQRVRVLVHLARRIRHAHPSIARVVAEVVTNVRPARDLWLVPPPFGVRPP